MNRNVVVADAPESPWSPPRFYGRWHRIGPRLLAGFLLVIVPTVVVGVFAVQRLNLLAGETTNLSTHDLPEIVIVDRLRTLLFQQQAVEQVAWSDQRLQAPIAAEISAQADSLRRLEEAPTVDSYPADTALIASLVRDIERGNAASARIQKLVLTGHSASAQALQEHQLLPLINAGLVACGKLKVARESEAAAAAASVNHNTATATRVVLLLTLLSVPLSAALAFLLTRSLQTPLSALLRATTALAAGDLQASPSRRSGDEIGQLADAFDTMRANLRATIAALAVERRQTQAIIDSCADGMILVDMEHQVLQINPAAEYLTECRAEDALGRIWWKVCGCLEKPPWVDLLPEQVEQQLPYQSLPACPHHAAYSLTHPSCPLCGSEINRAPRAEHTSYQMLVRLRSGKERWLAVSCATILGDPAAGERRLVVSLHDVSQLKAMDQLKSDFVAMVSHELRAPVTTVSSAVEMLQDLDQDGDAATRVEVLGLLSQQAGRLRTVVDEVLQVTRLESGRLHIRLQPVPLLSFSRQLLDRLRLEWSEAERPAVSLSGEEVLVWADPEMLGIVVRNLLDNVRKYTPSGSPVDIGIQSAPAEGRVYVRVDDYGPGIPAEQFDQIFDKFTRGSASGSSWTRGYGLGLYIARELLRAHNGDLSARNRQDGASFDFTLCMVAPLVTQ